MRWVDVCGPPGAGKSTICYPLWGDKEVTTDGLPLPAEWEEFIEETWRQLDFIANKPRPYIPELGRHLELVTPALRMTVRTLHKMAAVHRMPESERSPFIQTAFCQRVMGIGWRLAALGEDVNRIRPLLRLMPVSLGVVFLDVSMEAAMARNKARELVPATSHENRSYQVRLYQQPLRVAKDELIEIGVPVIELDVERSSPDESREKLKELFGLCSQ